MALKIEQILPADGHAIKRAQWLAGLQALACRLGFAKGPLRHHVDEDCLIIAGLDGFERLLGQRDGIEHSLSQLAAKFLCSIHFQPAITVAPSFFHAIKAASPVAKRPPYLSAWPSRPIVRPSPSDTSI